jgi:hypothetical protein
MLLLHTLQKIILSTNFAYFQMPIIIKLPDIWLRAYITKFLTV